MFFFSNNAFVDIGNDTILPLKWILTDTRLEL